MGRLSPRWAAALVALVGFAATAAAAAAASMTAEDAVRLTLWALGVAGVGTGSAAVVLMVTRGRMVTTQAVALSIATLVVVMVGAWIGARSMFLSDHDLDALAVLLLAAGTVGCVSMLALGERVRRANASLLEATRRLGGGELVLAAPSTAAAGDTARLADELMATADRLAESRRREQAVESARRELVAWISHDLRTPLAGIRAIAEALDDGVAADPVTIERYHELLRTEAERLSGLVDDLFEISRAHTGVLQLGLERVSLADLVSDAVAGMAPVAAAKRVRIEGRVARVTPELDASPTELLRVLRNLLENAVRHTPSDGAVVVESGRDDRAAFVSVIDSGGGIAPTDLPRVFEVGFRADPARTPGTGAGLGLAIAKGIVEAHRGDITVCNENGGARFTVRLPLANPGE